MTREEIFATSILDVPGISTQASNFYLRRVARKRAQQAYDAARAIGRTQDEAESVWDDFADPTRMRERYRDDPELTVGEIAAQHVWLDSRNPFPGSKDVVRFATAKGLTRVDWHALPYEENAVLDRLRSMGFSDIRALPIRVFGFITNGASWVCRMSGTRDVDATTVGQFLDSDPDNACVRSYDVNSVSYKRLAQLLGQLGFDAPVVSAGQRLLQSLIEDDQLSQEEAERFIAIGVRRGLIPASRL